jgi:uncharacterized LabA/DUF88 family protein
MWMPLVVPHPSSQIHANANSIYVSVTKTEEKGSDVNLASHLLLDGMKAAYKAAVIVSNDSDLCTPIRLARTELNLKVGVLNPNDRNPSAALKREAAFFKPIRIGALAANQFPPTVNDPVGVIHKPPEW